MLEVIQVTVNVKGLVTAASNVTITPAFGSVTGGTAGSVIFSNGTNLAQDNDNFLWDATNKRLGIGTNAPATLFHARITTDQNFIISGLVNGVDGVTIYSINNALDALKSFEVFSSTTIFGMGGNVGIGIANPSQKLQIIGDAIMISNTVADNTTKFSTWVTPSYDSDEEPTVLLFAANIAGVINTVNYGGGSGSYNSTQRLFFWTGSTINELSGTQRMLIDENGIVTLATGGLIWSTDNTYDIGVSGATRPRTGYFGTSVVTPVIELGATDTTLARVSAGVISVEGITIADISSAQTLTNKTIDEAIISGTPDAEGELGRDTTQKALNSYNNGVLGTIPKVILVGTGTETLTNTTSASLQNFTSIYTIPADFFVVNKVLRATFMVELVTGVNSITSLITLKIGSVTVSTTNTSNRSDSLTVGHSLQFLIVCKSVGGSGTLSTMQITPWGAAGENRTNQPVTIDTTVTNTLNLAVTWSGTGTPAETLEQQAWILEELN